MFQKISVWGVLLFAISGALATPLVPGSYQKSTESDLVARQISCPTGNCGPGPVCTPATCNLEGCKGTDVCQGTQNDKRDLAATLPKRSFGPCPPGEFCGHGPVCTVDLCDISGCEDAPVCQDGGDKKRRSTETLVARQFGCPDGIPCGHGPVCAGDFCASPGCVNAPNCQDYQNRKRNAATDIIHPVCDICIVTDNGTVKCGCATSKRDLKSRATEKICPLFCIDTPDEGELCGCAAEDYENSHSKA